MGWTAPRRHQACQEGRCHEPHLKGSRPWARLPRIWHESRELGSIWRRLFFRFTASARKARSSPLVSFGAGRCWSFSAGLRPAWWACGSAHHWGRQLAALGHEVKLIPPAHVKPYVRRNKTDAADAAAICEAAMRPGQRFVALRSIDNQAALMRHRVREQLVGQRTADSLWP